MSLRMPRISGEIERRLLVNYRVDPDVAARVLPDPFRPQLVDGHAVAGICLLRLGSIRPHRLPPAVGLRTENAAHRFSVEWDEPGRGRRTGVYIPRRDSAAWSNVVLGGRLFPGEHHHASFEVTESDERLRVAFAADDGSAAVDVAVEVTDDLGPSALFASLEDASGFFERGSLGYSATRRPGRYDGLALRTSAWRVEPVRVDHARSSYFEDPTFFPPGSAVLDHALLMRRVPVAWEAAPTMVAP
jgi:uncharacterized protein YqjF (DUF2071 family)